MINVLNISKKYEQKDSDISFLLSNISFSIFKNETFGIMGPSGSGKSTLLRLLSGQTMPDTGSVDILGASTKDLSKKAMRLLHQRTSFVFQNFNLLSNLSVLDNVLLPTKILKERDKKLLRAKALDLLDFVGLKEKTYSYPVTLSGGEQQRVAIARALINDPDIIFFDEPTSALDQTLALEVIKLIKHIKETFDLTIVIVSHQKEIIRFLCDRVLFLKDGDMLKLDKVNPLSESQVIELQNDWGDLYV